MAGRARAAARPAQAPAGSGVAPAGSGVAPAGRIGPNAILQLLAALEDALGPGAGGRLLAAAGLDGPPPEGMIPEDDARRLHLALRAAHPDEAAAIAAEAGARTAAYILTHRIPRPARQLLRALPPALAAALLSRAIARHAWTFAGSGRFRLVSARPPVFELAANPLVRGLMAAEPACDWHRAVFEGLFRALAGGGWRAAETACCAAGAPACRFELRRDER
jgi:divinyl protochlorophyllide a 8-vinyl-reductase